MEKDLEKESQLSKAYTSESSFSENEVDVALKFLKQNGDVERVIDDHSVDRRAIFYGSKKLDKKIKRKLDKYILSFLCVTYLLMFLDKALLNYAAAMGIKKNLKGDEFSNLSTIFSAAYIFMEPIVTLLIQYFPLSKIMGTFICTWGAVLACHSACKTYASLMKIGRAHV